MFFVEDYCGKCVCFLVWVKSENVKGIVNVWMWVDGLGSGFGQLFQFDNMKGCEVVGIMGWMQYFVVLDVFVEVLVIVMGFFVLGMGYVWFNDVSFEVVGIDVFFMNIKMNVVEVVCKRLRVLQNFDFGGSVEK